MPSVPSSLGLVVGTSADATTPPTRAQRASFRLATAGAALAGATAVIYALTAVDVEWDWLQAAWGISSFGLLPLALVTTLLAFAMPKSPRLRARTWTIGLITLTYVCILILVFVAEFSSIEGPVNER